MRRPSQAPIERMLEAAVAARVKRGTRGAARIAVIGEFNCGKTTLVNAMLGADVFPAGIAIRTEIPSVAQFASRPSLSLKLVDGRRIPLAAGNLGQPLPAGARQLHYQLPLERLRRVSIVDTPAVGLEHSAIAPPILQACRGADLLVWCTPAFQAWKHSEQLLWLSLPAALRKRGVLAVTFADQVASDGDLDRLSARLHADAGSFFANIVVLTGTSPPAAEPIGREILEKVPPH